MPVSSVVHKGKDDDSRIKDEKYYQKLKGLNIAAKPGKSGTKTIEINHDFPLLPSLDYFNKIVYRKYPKLLSQYLQVNSRFIGEQHSNLARYKINVEFKSIDLISSELTGFLQIIGLAENLQIMTTCFKGEIINNPLNLLQYQGLQTIPINKYSFITENKNWGSSVKNDLEHWKHLTNLNHLNDEEFTQKLQKIQNGQIDQNLIYMRWKEQFLLPDSRKKSISGTSFEGFYYIVLSIGDNDIPSGCISGLYYYKISEKFQSLNLKFLDNKGVTRVVDVV